MPPKKFEARDFGILGQMVANDEDSKIDPYGIGRSTPAERQAAKDRAMKRVTRHLKIKGAYRSLDRKDDAYYFRNK